MIIGVTGCLATGTSLAADYIAKNLKADLLIADKLAHLALKKNSGSFKAIVSVFGKSILNDGGAIDRKRLSEKAFKSKKSLKRLTEIIHPEVIGHIRKKINKIHKESSFLVVDGPVLIESGFYKECDKLIVVTSSLVLQLERAKKHKGIEFEDALSRISLQMPLYKKVRYADYIIDNIGRISELKTRCNKVAESIRKNK
ncbi:dephospho-CoA kinase [Candidatus Omnitrophota bacterium]